MLNLRDTEQRGLAHELHDSIAQALAGLAMNLAVVAQFQGRLPAAARTALSEGMTLADQCVQAIRTISYLLHPPLLDDIGLAATVRWYSAGFVKRSGIQLDVEVAADLGRMPPDIETALFRVLQEALTNVQCHAGSPTASVRVVRAPTAVILEVADKGRGIAAPVLGDLGQDTVPLGVGIMGMRERMRQLGGDLHIRSSSGGTTVTATVPLTTDPT